MALQIDYTTKSNVNSNYTRVGIIDNKKIVNSLVNPNTRIFVERWKDSSTRELAKQGGSQSFIETQIFETDQAFSDIASVYTYLKTLPDFNGAEDC